MTKTEIADKLKSARIASGLTQKDVAESVGRSSQLVGHWETGYSQPDADTLCILLQLYGLDANSFFGVNKKAPAEKLELSDSETDFITSYRLLRPEHREALRYFVVCASQQAVVAPPLERPSKEERARAGILKTLGLSEDTPGAEEEQHA